MKTYEQYIQELIPHWMLGSADPANPGWGRRFFGSIGFLADQMVGAARELVKARYIEYAPSDALPLAVRDADVPVFLEFDTEGRIRARVGGAWTWHQEQGTAEVGIPAIFEILGFDPDETTVVDISLGESWCHESGWWSFWWVFTRNPLSWGLTTTTWDDGASETWDEGIDCWDFTCPASLWTQLNELLWTRKWAHGVPVAVAVVFGDAELWDEPVWTGLTWDEADGLTWDEGVADSTLFVLPLAELWDVDIRPATDTYDGSSRTWGEDEAIGAIWSSRARMT